MKATEADLIARAKEGDHEAFTELVSRHEERVYRLARRVVGEDESALDVMQEVFLSVYTKLPGFRGEAAFSTWLYRITLNAALARKGDAQRHDHLPLDDVMPDFVGLRVVAGPDWSDRPDREILAREAAEMVESAINALPEDFRAVFLLRDVEGMSNQEAAEILDLTVAAVKSRLHRARLFLRRQLGEYFGRAA
jgi:RNA polymerase sigma-70 factor (ECF subfamily)